MSKAALEWATLLESFSMALGAVRASKLRSILTLLGVAVGVFSIISVMTAVGVLQNSIEEGLTQLGANTFQIQKYPNFSAGRRDRARYRNRRDITYEQAIAVRDQATLAEAVGIEVWRGGRIVYWRDQRTESNVGLAGENVDGLVTNDWDVGHGRGLTRADVDYARNVIILGAAVRERLFPPFVDPLGERVRVDGAVYEVIGVFAERGATLGGGGDNFAVIPITSYFELYGKARRSLNILVKAKSREVFDDAVEQARFILRTARKVAPGDEDDFFW